MKRHGPRRTSLELRPDELGLPSTGGPRLFLGRLTPDAVRGELEASGIAAFLASRGFADLDVRTDLDDGEHRLRVEDARDGGLLVDLRLAERATLAPATLHVLAVLWVVLQDPRASFSAERPRLPGQDHPGLGVGRRLYALLRQWCERWGKDALWNVPEHYHNALFYAGQFRFLDAAEQGRFEALRRDLSGMPVAEASFAVEAGRVRDEAAGRAYAWDPGAMVSPLTPTVVAVLASDGYQGTLAAARDAARFRIT